MRETPNLLLKLPEPTDYVLVEDLNENFTKIDTEIAKISDEETGVRAQLAKHLDEDAKTIKVKQNISILSDGWVDETATSGFWKYEILNADISANTIVDVNIHLADLDKASDIKPSCISSTGKVTLYADSNLTENITVDLKLIRELGVV